jgi:pimeloyl-ACP methyl ester carboxylesterase
MSELPQGPPRRMAVITAGSIALGLIGAIALVLGPASGATEALVTGSVTLALGLGWAMLALLSQRYTDQPQRWAWAPAIFFGVSGLALVVFSPDADAMDLLGWMWPPVLLGVVVWAFVGMRRSLRGRSRWIVTPLLGILALSAIGGAFQAILDGLDRAGTPDSGSLVDVGGRNLYLECAGAGSPTVILQSGLGEDSSYWARIRDSVSEQTMVCAYDRAGRGFSDSAGEQDGLEVSRDLHRLLSAAGVEGPYVLVGHSTGGPYNQVFAARHPDEVAGMVFIDAQPTAAFTTLPEFPDFHRSIRFWSSVFPTLARLGLGRLTQTSPRSYTAARDEYAMLPATLREGAQLTTLGDRPVAVVTRATDLQAGWTAAQGEMLELSTNVSHRTPPGSTHYSLIDDAEDSEESIQAILDVVEAVRTGGTVQSR